ncbi:uncharacterized protein LOC120446263 isoform X1 [Drosophila santomea]|uniref:uncharacterized protein LOC120446263 isoform X1 n=1 Tax=Drosophila santomea TaxID=129105 RepID=UPI00195419F7|nr:uncharacterized protein LOC120446263 isoform X1 [Drosophila santomea]
MEKNNKCYKQVKEHGAPNPPPLNAHKQLKFRDLECRSRKEKIKSTENMPKTCKHHCTTNKHQRRQDHHCDHKKHSCKDRESPVYHEQHFHRAHNSFSKKCSNGNYQPAQNQQCQQQSKLKVEREPSPIYTPKQPIRPVYFPNDSKKQKAVIEKGCGDRLLYKNLSFEAYPSSKSEHGEGEGGGNVKEPPLRLSHQKQKKDSFDHLKAAKAHCQAVGERFQKFAPCSKCSSSNDSKSKPSGVTVISAKSGDDLRAAVRSQIEVQEALNAFTLEVKNKREEVHPDEKSFSAKPKKSRRAAPDTKTEKTVVPTAGSHQLSILTPDDLELLNLSDSSGEVTKILEPVIRNIQRMYLNTLKDEMTLMEYLAKVPTLIRKAYKQQTDGKEQNSPTEC